MGGDYCTQTSPPSTLIPREKTEVDHSEESLPQGATETEEEQQEDVGEGPKKEEAAMKSPPPEIGPPKEEKHDENEAEEKPSVKSQVQSESEKDSGYSDSSSESLSSEETNGSTSVRAPGPGAQGTTRVQTAYTPIYILQNVVLKQPRLLLLQPPTRRHRKCPAPSSYLPILRSYPRIAPRLAPPPTPSRAPSPVPGTAPPPMNRPAASHLLEVSLRSLALLRRTRETQRSVRELRAHTRLYERALQGEEGGWERLQRVMEQSGGYRRIAQTTPQPATSQEVTMTSSGDEETRTSSEKSVTSSGSTACGCEEGNV